MRYLFAIPFVLLSLGANAAMVTYTFDDGHKSVFENAFPILNKYGHSATAYVITSNLQVDLPNRMSGDDLVSLQSAGWEIGSHSLYHKRLTQLPERYEDEQITGWSFVEGSTRTYSAPYDYDEVSTIYANGKHVWKRLSSIDDVDASEFGGYYFDQDNGRIYVSARDGADLRSAEVLAGSAERQLQQSADDLRGYGLDVNSFAAPYGDYSDEILGLADPYFESFMSNNSPDEALNQLPVDAEGSPVLLSRLGGIKNDTGVDYVKAMIDQAIAENAWLILTLHRIEEDGSDDGWDKSKLDEIASYIASKDIDVVTVSDGLKAAPVPLPPAIWLFLSAIVAMLSFRRAKPEK